MTKMQEYLMRYQSGCAILATEFNKYRQIEPKEENIDDLIKAIDLIHNAICDTRRSLLFFKALYNNRKRDDILQGEVHGDK